MAKLSRAEKFLDGCILCLAGLALIFTVHVVSPMTGAWAGRMLQHQLGDLQESALVSIAVVLPVLGVALLGPVFVVLWVAVIIRRYFKTDADD